VLEHILFLDLETTEKGKIRDVGALLGNSEIHESTIDTLSSWIEKSKIICGHNILKHDIPILADKLGRSAFKTHYFWRKF
jgi:ATP-dependent DNA helicase RecQ